MTKNKLPEIKWTPVSEDDDDVVVVDTEFGGVVVDIGHNEIFADIPFKPVPDPK